MKEKNYALEARGMEGPKDLMVVGFSRATHYLSISALHRVYFPVQCAHITPAGHAADAEQGDSKT